MSMRVRFFVGCITCEAASTPDFELGHARPEKMNVHNLGCQIWNGQNISQSITMNAHEI